MVATDSPRTTLTRAEADAFLGLPDRRRVAILKSLAPHERMSIVVSLAFALVPQDDITPAQS